MVYPDRAWAAGIQGDVTVKTCPGSSPRILMSGAPELVSAALQMSRTTVLLPDACKQRRFAFRRWPSQGDVLELTGQKDTILITRGLERAWKTNCSSPDPLSEDFISGRSVAVLTIEESGHVSALSLRQTVGGVNEARWTDWLKTCAFSPATLDGKPVASHYVITVEWRQSR
jgi:hypothetical protein